MPLPGLSLYRAHHPSSSQVVPALGVGNPVTIVQVRRSIDGHWISPFALKKCQVRCFHQSKQHFSPEAGQNTQEEFFNEFKASLHFPRATTRVRDIVQNSKPDSKIVIHGYLGSRSDLSKKLSFVPLKDLDGSQQIQVVSTPTTARNEAHQRLRSMKAYQPVVIEGSIQAKTSRKPNSTTAGASPIANENIELLLEDIQPLNDVDPEVILKDGVEYNPDQRHLRLRTDPTLRDTLHLRSKVMRVCHEALEGFEFIETPLLFKSTSEGANEFIVPTRREGLAYSLPQSPQQFKQVLMAGGISKYYQFARCFRDEDLRADRQPEFTQLDIEMAFATGKDVREEVESLTRLLWSRFLAIDLPKPFRQMTYHDAMLSYGVDKPDLRIPYKIYSNIHSKLPIDFIQKITHLEDPAIDALTVPLDCAPDQSRHLLREFFDSAEGSKYLRNPDGGPGIFIFDSRKPLQGLSATGFEGFEVIMSAFEGLSDGHLVILQARKNEPFSGGSTALGNLRLAIHDFAVQSQLLVPPGWGQFEPVWIIDFPLFSPSTADEPGQGGASGLASTHHPFTSPKRSEDVDLLRNNPSQVTGDHYDLVINGEEIAGGSRRIHHAGVQEYIFRDVLRMEEEKISEFTPLLNALKAGCPPHAGIAFGFDRLVAMVRSHMLGKKVSIRDTIAFPKSGSGEDPMMRSPGRITDAQLERYHLKRREQVPCPG